MDAPMQWTKQIASHFGGTRNGMVVSWPARIKDKGGLRSQFCHVIDIVPTIYEAANITPPTMLDGVEQKPIEGVSLVYSFDDAKAPTRRTASADSARTGVASGRTGVRAIADIQLRARRTLHRPKHLSIDAPTERREGWRAEQVPTV